MNKYNAVVFDLNGVVINDERIHQESWRILCKKHGIKLTEDQFKQNVFGRTEKDVLRYIFNKDLTDSEMSTYLSDRVRIAIDLFTPKLALTEGLYDFLEELEKFNIPVGLATGSRNVYVNFILDGLKIRHFFKGLVTADDVTKGKPDPQIYLLAAQKINISPGKCIAFEDSISGIKSAKAAGMYTVAITTTHAASELTMADKVINSFKDVSAESLSLV